MIPLGPLDDRDEQSEAERLAVARRYRELHTRELDALAEPALPRRPLAVGEFSSVPLEALAAIPLLGAFFAFAVRVGRSRKSVGANLLVAIDAEQLHLLSVSSTIEGPTAKLLSSWPRETVRVASVRRRFMRDEVVIELPDAEPLRLYASTLRTNPWAAAVVRELGGEAPEPLDLGGE